MNDPEQCRVMAERWDDPNETPGCTVLVRGLHFTAGQLLRGIADAMDEALESEETEHGE